MAKTLIVLLSVPFALVGGFWLIYLLGYNLSVAVWVGFIALAGVSAEIGVVMVVSLDLAYSRRQTEGAMNSLKDLYNSIIEGAVMRLRPIIMTATAINRCAESINLENYALMGWRGGANGEEKDSWGCYSSPPSGNSDNRE